MGRDANKSDINRLSYREEDVDETLAEHERRITRLEKVSLVVMGYLIADGATIVNELSALL